MDWLEDLLKILLPALIVFATTYFMIRSFLENESRKRLMEAKMSNQNLITPVRLQAYERVTLFLERISPDSLILRVYRNGMSARFFQSELVKTIRSEFEYNLSQQIYMSGPAWEMIKNAKEETIKLVNIASTRVADDAAGTELGVKIGEIASQVTKLPSQAAIEFLKKEIGKSF